MRGLGAPSHARSTTSSVANISDIVGLLAFSGAAGSKINWSFGQVTRVVVVLLARRNRAKFHPARVLG